MQVLFSLFFSLLSCFVWAQTDLPAEDMKELKLSFSRPKDIPFPADNAFTQEKFELGKKLFFDPRLSSSGFISCATCHNPMFGWEDGLHLGHGHGMKRLGRHTPTILNLAWGESFFWDGRSKTLEEQALGPIESLAEMNMSSAQLEKDLQKINGYVEEFTRVFSSPKITKHNIAKAIATFERKIISHPSPFDQWLEGNEGAISQSAKRGFVLFNTKARCVSCHSSWRFTDDSFHDIGMRTSDVGRYKIHPTEMAKFAFKTPTLRNIARRAPYMHNGSKKTLEEVMDFYNRGGDVKRKSLSSEMKPLGLQKEELMDVIEFLKSLTSNESGIELPVLPFN